MAQTTTVKATGHSTRSPATKTGPAATGRNAQLKSLVEKASQFKISTEMYMRVAQDMWAGLESPRSLSCKLLLDAGEYAQLVNLQTLPQEYLDRDDIARFVGGPGMSKFWDDYQCRSLLAKWPGFEHADLDPVGRCIQSDEDAENNCIRSNRRLRNALVHPEGCSQYLHLIFGMQADIARTLGGFDPTEWEHACRFGPGKALGQPGEIDYEKLISKPSCTAEFLPLGVTLLAGSDVWLDAVSETAPDPFNSQEGEWAYRFTVDLVQGDKCSMVLKNAKTRRGIRAQPGLNVYAQLGLGEMMRARLKLSGLDLDDQSGNQDLARRGSIRGSSLVTIDLRTASGHICTVLVDILCSEVPRWKFAMDSSRTTQYLPHGGADWRPLASYSAMGNGFTFELETLIFWSAVRACRRAVGDSSPFRVYGDDIICGRKTADLLIPFLDFLGFPLNPAKTFLDGPFRESCGTDYWDGINVRPIFLSATPEEILEDNNNGTAILRWLQVCNSIRRYSYARNHNFGCDRRLLECWRNAALRIPRPVRNALKSTWLTDQDTTLITHLEDAMSNPLMRYCGNLQSLIVPRLYGRRRNLVPESFLGVRAALTYRCRGGSVVCRYDRNWSRLQRVLQLNALPKSLVQASCGALSGVKPGVEMRNQLLPARHGIRLGGGWEVFQPFAGWSEWTTCPG